MWKVVNISAAHLPLKGTKISIAPKQEIDLCEVLESNDLGDIRNRPDVSHWLKTGRIHTLGFANTPKEAVKSPAPDPEDQAEPVRTPVPLSQDLLEQLPLKKIKLICGENDIQPSKSKADMIVLILDKLGGDNDEERSSEETGE